MRFKKLIAMSFAAVMVFTSAMANIVPAYANRVAKVEWQQ